MWEEPCCSLPWHRGPSVSRLKVFNWDIMLEYLIYSFNPFSTAKLGKTRRHCVHVRWKCSSSPSHPQGVCVGSSETWHCPAFRTLWHLRMPAVRARDCKGMGNRVDPQLSETSTFFIRFWLQHCNLYRMVIVVIMIIIVINVMFVYKIFSIFVFIIFCLQLLSSPRPA